MPGLSFGWAPRRTYHRPQNTRCHHLRFSSHCHLNCRGLLPFQPWMQMPDSAARQSPGQSPQQCLQCRVPGMRRSPSAVPQRQ